MVGRNQEQTVGAAAMCRQDQDRMALIAFADGVQVRIFCYMNTIGNGKSVTISDFFCDEIIDIRADLMA